MSRFVRPDTTVLKISNGDTLTVKRHLNTGEQRHLRGMQMFSTLERVAVLIAYLVDWSLTDDNGKHVDIAGLDSKAANNIVDSLDQDSFDEIYAAIAAHRKAMDAEREAEKNAQDGATKSSAISPSPDASAGASSGCAN